MKSFDNFTAIALSTATLLSLVSAQSCSLSPSGSIKPSVASGYQMQVVATGLSTPRGISFDSAGHLLVVEKGRGLISAHTLRESDGCVTVVSSEDVTTNLSLNHGIQMSTDGRTLYASSTEYAYSWDYDESAQTVSNMKTLVGNMSGTDHTTRTLLLSKKVPGMLVVARGSTQNIDFQAASERTGISQVKAFNIGNMTETYQYDTDGMLLGWGLRNEVGLGEHPVSGGIWGVENSADQINRTGVDIHEDNPAEELNFLGYLNGTSSSQQGSNFGYPWCFSAWTVSDLPDRGNLQVGDQFAVDASPASNNENKTDQYCAEQTRASLVFQAHMAPLDIKFNDSGKEAWITWHGSWDRTDPVGYKLSVVAFNEDGTPVDERTSKTAATDIFANADNSKCPENCFRPVAMAIDLQGRIFMSSDSTGEIYLISKTGSATSSSSPSGTSTTSSSASATSSAAAAVVHSPFSYDANKYFGGLYILSIYVVIVAATVFGFQLI